MGCSPVYPEIKRSEFASLNSTARNCQFGDGLGGVLQVTRAVLESLQIDLKWRPNTQTSGQHINWINKSYRIAVLPTSNNPNLVDGFTVSIAGQKSWSVLETPRGSNAVDAIAAVIVPTLLFTCDCWGISGAKSVCKRSSCLSIE